MKQRRGFAVMTREKHLELSRRGGQASGDAGGHRWTEAEARKQGKRGGRASARRRRREEAA